MNKFLVTFFAVCAMTQVGHAQEASFQSEELNLEDAAYSETLSENMAFNGDMDRPGRGGRGDDRRGDDRRGDDRRGGGRDDHRGPDRGRPGHGPGRPGPGHGGPGYPGPRPPQYRVEYVACGAYGYQYNECFVNAFRVNSIRLYRQDSREACIYGRSFGFNQNRIWTSNGCRAVFAVERY